MTVSLITTRLQQLDLPQPVAVIGAGVTGRSGFDVLQLAGIACQVFDESASLPQAFADAANHVVLGQFSEQSFNDYATILLSPGVDTRRLCFAAHQDKLLTDIELFAQLTEKPLIGVTGSNGKSTVVSLAHHVTQHADKNYILCGNIGLPVLKALADNEADCEGYIIELSSYQLERVPTLSLTIGVWLNVSPDHLDRYDSYGDYVKTKAKIIAISDHLIVNADDQKVTHHSQNHQQITWFSQQIADRDYYYHEPLIYHQGKVVFDMRQFAQLGAHYADDVMAVFAICLLLGIDRTTIASACQTFTPLASRSVLVGEKHGVTFINDSKGTNVGAAVAAINGLSQPIILIAGGQGKGQNFSDLAIAGRDKLKAVFLLGEAAKVLQTTLSEIVDCYLCQDLADAVKQSIAAADAGDIVLLSPACASFDMFSSYLVRGEAFEQLVRNYLDE